MAYKVIILYRLYMPSYFLGTFAEYPFLHLSRDFFHSIRFKVNKVGRKRSPIFYAIL